MFNTLMRNVASFKGKGEFEKRLIKATYTGDTSSPKEKHIQYLIDCLRGINTELSLIEAVAKIIERCFKNIKSFPSTLKTYYLLHRFLRDKDVSHDLSKELKNKEHMLYSYQKKLGDNSLGQIEARMSEQLCDAYINYLRLLIGFSIRCKILEYEIQLLSEILQDLSNTDILWIAESLIEIISYAFQLFEFQPFCKKTRLSAIIITTLFNDVLDFYSRMYILVTEILRRFVSFDVKESKRSFVIYMDLIKLTDDLKKSSDDMRLNFKLKFTNPPLYEVDPKLLCTLKTCITEKEQKFVKEQMQSTTSTASTSTIVNDSRRSFCDGKDNKKELRDKMGLYSGYIKTQTSSNITSRTASSANVIPDDFIDIARSHTVNVKSEYLYETDIAITKSIENSFAFNHSMPCQESRCVPVVGDKQ